MSTGAVWTVDRVCYPVAVGAEGLSPAASNGAGESHAVEGEPRPDLPGPVLVLALLNPSVLSKQRWLVTLEPCQADTQDQALGVPVTLLALSEGPTI